MVKYPWEVDNDVELCGATQRVPVQREAYATLAKDSMRRSGER